jgi:hypothetical protein
MNFAPPRGNSAHVSAAAALGVAFALTMPEPPRRPGGAFAMGYPPTKKKPAKVERNRARAKAAKKARKAQRRRR